MRSGILVPEENVNEMMTMTTDISIRDRQKKLAALVELKNIPNLSPERAEEVRQSMGMDDADAPYFLLISQDKGYIWARSQGNAAPARVELNMKQALSRYWPAVGKSAQLRHSELQLLVLQWLWDLITASSMPRTGDSIRKKLSDIGLLNAIREGDVEVEASS